jgi:ATP-binding cassette subfamily B protein
MNILYYLLEKFLKEESTNTIILILLSLTLTLFQTNGISFITAKIIEGIHKQDMSVVYTNYKYFIMITVVFFILYYIYKYIQNNLLMKMMQTTKHEILKLILTINNENMSNVNYIEFITPITRISVSFYVLFSNLVSVLIPTVAFLLVISGYFLYKNTFLGTFFLFANAFICLYVSFFWNEMLEYKNKHETKINDNEKYIIDLLNNIDKVIYRGQNIYEIDTFNTKTEEGIKLANSYMTYITNHTMLMNSMVYLIIFVSVFYLIQLRSTNKIDIITFITFFTILLMYRDRMLGTLNEIPEYLEFIGRIEYIMVIFNEMLGGKTDMQNLMDKTYKDQTLEFDRVRFENVSFKYDGTDKMILKNFNINLDVNDKIIGLVGLSGKGKSSFVKLILRLYDCTSGDIYIDNVDITQIDPNYIRSNITYVNQNSKLFDKKVIENILYGCSNLETCNDNLKEILQYSKIQELFKNVDINKTSAGSLGENLSGGQRQIVNIISGLINPSKILILDEPTNALDPELKRQLLLILTKFKKYKKSIIIITHDKDVHSLFDETIQL